MYKVFVTDDEIVIREGLRNSLALENTRFTLVGEAPDGEIALPMIRDEKPDILITDIRMPFMDGLQLCREVRRVMPWIQIIILSGYNDFDFAKQAISLGVKEYLLKPIRPSDLMQVLERIASRIDDETSERANLDKLRRQLATGKAYVKEQLIGNILIRPMEEEEGVQIIEQMRMFGINLVANCYLVMEFRRANRDLHSSEVEAVLARLTEESRDTIFLSSNENGLNALVLGDNDKDIEERAYSFARSALDEMDRAGCGAFRVTIGETVKRFCDVSQSMHSARHTRHLLEYCGVSVRSKRVVGVRDIPGEQSSSLPTLEIQPLFDRMKYAEPEEVAARLHEYVNTLQTADVYISIAAGYLRAEVLMTAFRMILEAGGDPKAILDSEWLEDEHVMNGAEIEAYVPTALAILQRAVAYRSGQSRMKGNPVVNKARGYLEKEFANSSLTFQKVIDYVAMSGSHFSTIFAQEMGMTFTEYLTSLRLNKAKELLGKTNMRSSEIAYAVGYNDPHYFSYLFKKNVGMTPSDYRSNNTEGAEKQ